MRTLLAMVLAGGLAAHAGVNGVSVEKLAKADHVRVSYTLTEDAVVTFDVLTNGAPVAAERCTSATGAVFRLVRAGSASFDWAPGGDLAGLRYGGDGAQVRVKAWPTNAPPDWMVLNLAPAKANVDVNYYETQEQIPGSVTNKVYKRRKMILRKIPAAQVTWRMGAPTGETGGASTLRYVTLTEDYYMGIYMVTGAQMSFMSGSALSSSCSPSTGSYLSWRGSASAEKAWPAGGHEITNETSRLYRIRDYTGIPFDLPTEAQWEFACRAGTATALYTGENLLEATESENLDEIAWYYYNWGAIHGDPTKNGYNQKFPEVGLLKPNPWGLYDMLGSAFEWCLDWWGGFTAGENVTDPKGPSSNGNSRRVLRGGSMDQAASTCRAAYRTYNPDSYGLYSAGLLQCSDGKCVQNYTARLCCPAIAVR